jgi:hypothetical protein
MALIPNAVSLTAVTSVVGAAAGISTTGFIDSPDYTTELAALKLQIVALNETLDAMITSMGTVSNKLAEIQLFLAAIQTETGDFRTLNPGSPADVAIVTTALTKSNIPAPPFTGL